MSMMTPDKSVAAPQIGETNTVTPSVRQQIFEGNSGKEESPVGE